ncbi:MAG: hypothetical protein BroJett013_06890 [Alphaproteobacteria bacterium]|nr:MAG: hypothetical protein BroJett013_06890 [Alphaproteobacteria bacterium]
MTALSSHDEARFDYEGDRSVDRWTQVRAEKTVNGADEALAKYREASRQLARDLHALGLLDIDGYPPRGSCSSAEEVIEGAAEEAELFFHTLCKGEVLARARANAEGREDD